MLSEKEKESLLKLARKTLEEGIKGEKVLPFFCLSGEMSEPKGAFVTLRKKDQLRGCIGRFESPDPLYQTVQKMALAAATQDPRFPPVQSFELSDVDIEISVLSLRHKINDVREIEVGRHGLSVAKGLRRGVLLPQVAIEENWSREEFLSHTCLKAGLEPDAWREGNLEIEIFTAEVFGEKT